jgi:outer membrane protein TolC
MRSHATDGTPNRQRSRRWTFAGGRLLLLAPVTLAALGGCATHTEIVEASWRHEQRTIDKRDSGELPSVPLPKIPPPLTVGDDKIEREELPLALNDAIRMTLDNAKAIRVFNGLGASNSGRTIYDPAITTTTIDQRQARFDPTVSNNLTYTQAKQPQFVFDPLLPPLFIGFDGVRNDTLRNEIGVGKTNATGGRSNLSLIENPNRIADPNQAINPQNRSSVALGYTQPLLQGGGFAFNTAPIVLARIDTERSYFQFKDSVQELVRGTIEAYWNLVFARLELWARQIQLEQSQEAFNREEARKLAGIGDLRNVAQAKVTLNQFNASLIAAKANVLSREGALRNILGLPPSDTKYIVPVSAPANLRYAHDWDKLLQLAEQRRPDIVELKLVLEADNLRKLQAENFTLPQLDANAQYRWNGLSGEVPTGERLYADHGKFPEWQVGITFSVPLGLREGRARVREQNLIILRDRANLEQGLHAAGHDIAVTVRDLENAYAQYLAFRETRKSALDNLLVQEAEQKAGRGIYLSVLQALNDWGNAVTSEARSLVDYNTLLARLEQQTGTILDTHGLVFLEERFQAAGPLGRLHERDYPQSLKPVGNTNRYPATNEPGENSFELKKPGQRVPEKMPEKVPEKMPEEKPKEKGKTAPKNDVDPPGPKFAEDK